MEYKKYSIVGWSDGAKTALLMAAKYRDEVESLVLVSVSNAPSNRCLNALLQKKSVDSWHKDKVEAYVKVFGTKDELQKQWSRYLKFVEFYTSYFPNDIFANKYNLVNCPVLVVHGDKVSHYPIGFIVKDTLGISSCLILHSYSPLLLVKIVKWKLIINEMTKIFCIVIIFDFYHNWPAMGG